MDFKGFFFNSVESFETLLHESKGCPCTGIKVVVSTAKTHSERGLVEPKIRSLRESLEKMGVNTKHPQTVLQWETLFSKIANTVDNLPMVKGNTLNASNLGYEIITPNRLKLGRNNYWLLEGLGIKLDMASNIIAVLEQNRELYCEWYRIFIEDIHMLELRPTKWLKNTRLPVLDDIVVFVFNYSEYGKGGLYGLVIGKDYKCKRNPGICYVLCEGCKPLCIQPEKCQGCIHSVL